MVELLQDLPGTEMASQTHGAWQGKAGDDGQTEIHRYGATDGDMELQMELEMEIQMELEMALEMELEMEID